MSSALALGSRLRDERRSRIDLDGRVDNFTQELVMEDADPSTDVQQ